MAGCCDPSGYRRVFNTKEATKAARTYRRKGLDSTAEAMVEALAPHVAGVTILEGGSGSGGSHVELLKRGAARAVSVDISDAYEPSADAIAEDQGVADRIERRVGDFVVLAPELPEADVVYLNRVVCCYPDMPGMVDAAAGRSRRFVAMSYPRDRWFVRSGLAVLNWFLRRRRVPFQVFVHDPMAIGTRMRTAGYTEAVTGRTPFWHWGVWRQEAA